MLTWIFYVVVLAFLVLLFSVIFGPLFGPGSAKGARGRDREQANAAALAEGRIDDVAFDVVSRGYRQDQVDALLEELRAQYQNYYPNRPQVHAHDTLTVGEENS